MSTGRKLIFLDIDGTLTPFGSNRPPQSAVDAIAAARRNGHLVFICTGRNRQMHYSVLQYGMDGAVGAAGALVYIGEERIWSMPMTDSAFSRLLEVLHRENIECMPECEYVVYADPGPYHRIKNLSADGSGSAFAVEAMENYKGEPVYKVVYFGARQDALERASHELGEEYQFIIQANMSDKENAGKKSLGGEIIVRGVDKALGMHKVCEHYGMSMEDTIAFGDSTNDIEMLAAAGIGVAMGNSDPEAKEAADMTCPDVSADGLAEGFRMLGLI